MLDEIDQERRKRLIHRLKKLYEQYDLETRVEERLRTEGHIDITKKSLRELSSDYFSQFKKMSLLAVVVLVFLLAAATAVWFWLQPNSSSLESVETLLNQGEYQQAQTLCQAEPVSKAREQCLKITGFFLSSKPIESFEAEIKHSDSVYALVMQAEAATARQEFAIAKSLYEQALKANPKLAQAYFGLGQVYQLQNKPLDALTWYQQALERAPKNRRFLFNLASLQAELQQWDEAAKNYNLVLSYDNTLMLAYIELIQVYQAQGDRVAAKELAETALSLFEKNQAQWQQQELNQIPWQLNELKPPQTLYAWDDKQRYFIRFCQQVIAV